MRYRFRRARRCENTRREAKRTIAEGKASKGENVVRQLRENQKQESDTDRSRLFVRNKHTRDPPGNEVIRAASCMNKDNEVRGGKNRRYEERQTKG